MQSQAITFEVRSWLLASSLLRVSGLPLRTQLGVTGPAVRSAVVAGATTIDLDMMFSGCCSWMFNREQRFNTLVYYEDRRDAEEVWRLQPA